VSVHWAGRGPGHVSRKSSAATAAAFTPASLSPAAWYDPSDLSTLFQDTAGTTPVTTAGQSVARINDKSGNGLTLTQSTSTKCPTYQVDGNGKPYILFDGTNDTIGNSAAVAGSAHAIGIAVLATAGNQVWATTASSTDRLCIVATPASGTTRAVTHDGTTATAKSGSGSDTAQVLLAELDQAAPSAALRQNGVALSGTSSVTPDSNVGTALGSNTSGLNFFGGRVYGLVHVASAITATQRGQLETWLGAKCGLTL